MNALLQVAQVNFSYSFPVSSLGSLIADSFLELIQFVLWQHFLKNGLCSLKTCRCLAEVGLFSRLPYQLA